MIERGGELPVTRQAELLGLSRSSVYYVARPWPARDLVLMRRLDELHLSFVGVMEPRDFRHIGARRFSA
jgi:putative transposase